MDLIPNSTFRLLADVTSKTHHRPGIYRVIFDDIPSDTTVAVLIQPEDSSKEASGGRPKALSTKRPRKKPPARLVGKLVWMNRGELRKLEADMLLQPFRIERPSSAYSPPHSDMGKKLLAQRADGMQAFLDLQKLHEGIFVHKGLGGLVKEARQRSGWTKSTVYKLWSLLCKFGISAVSLKPSHEQCGAKGVARPVNPGGRLKAGRKTLEQRLARAHGVIKDSKQPGVSSAWIAAVLAADSRIPTPKPSWPSRCDQIVKSAFVSVGKEENGKIVLVKPALGEYPNRKQMFNILTKDKSRLDLLIEKTTKRHFGSTLRGLSARNWEGVAGPGHTWAIDSTVGDIYLRSSINRSWVIGRPIVYVDVDVWSTAVVGFYVCLTGPSWNTAKVSLFNATADPLLLGELWGYQPMVTLSPAPTMPFCLICDRGEYLSTLHRQTALKVIPMTSYAPPYRGDMKGIVEVLHRIAKDAQFLFIPGAMDFRRKELELRRVNPNESVLTMREYVNWLHLLFAKYNLTADRRHRIDAHMEVVGVHPSPAGLWSWGFQMGIGFRQHISGSDLITSLLPSAKARIGRNSVRFLGCDYSSKEVHEQQWTSIARNFGGSDININHYEGSMSRIWTPNVGGSGMMELRLSDQTKVSAEATFYEYMDTVASAAIRKPDVDHANMMIRLDIQRRQQELVDSALDEVRRESAKPSGKKPTMSEARRMESPSERPEEALNEPSARGTHEDSAANYQALMDALFQEAEGQQDA